MRLAAPAIVFAWLFLGVHALLAETPEDSHAYTMSFNEWWYSHVKVGDWPDPFLPPMFVNAGFNIPGQDPLVGLRLVSFISGWFLTFLAVLLLPRENALLLSSLPWLIVWSGRGQTDALMLALAMGGVLVARRVNPFLGGLMVGLSVFAKPPGALAALGLPWRDWRASAGFLLGLAPFLAWALTRQGTVWAFHANSSPPFGNLILNLGGVMLGLGGVPWLLARHKMGFRGWHLPPAVAFLTFAFWKAPIGHEYYLLPGLAFLALGPVWVNVERVATLNALLGVGLLGVYDAS